MSTPFGRRPARSFTLSGSAAANNRASSIRSTSPPPCGEGSGVGVSSGFMTSWRSEIFPSGIELTPPPLTPPRKGEGDFDSPQINLGEVLQLARFQIPFPHE